MIPFFKNFQHWFGLKPSLDSKNHKPPFVSEGQIWWCHLGENIGTEISGKGEKFTRPVLIFKKLSHYTYCIIPLSTKEKKGSWYISFLHRNISVMACLHQVRIVDYKRLDDKMGLIDETDFLKIQYGFQNLYTKNLPPIAGGTQENPEYSLIVRKV
ncbi:MAG: type II toxin-antitoxin system PemK/MazF family toxin [Candidatus Peregrinibacteria bacterium]